MGRRHQIDIMGALCLQLHKNFRQSNDRNHLSPAFSGNLSVLTENTAQMAARKKHGSGPLCSGNTGFFPHMERRSGHLQFRCLAAEAPLSFQTVHTTFP